MRDEIGLSAYHSRYYHICGQNYPDWVPGFLKSEEIKSEIQELKDSARSIKRTSRSGVDALAIFKKSHEAYLERRKKSILRFVEGYRNSKDPFRRFENGVCRNEDLVTIPLIRFDEIEEALDNLPGGILDSDREAELEKLEEKITTLKIELKNHSPLRFFSITNGEVRLDYRDAFVDAWFQVQQKCSEPCNPKGFVLKESTPDERQAWSDLGLGMAVNSKSRFLPHGYTEHFQYKHNR